MVNDNYQNDSRALYTFAPNKSFGQLLDISRNTFGFLENFNSEFSRIKVSFFDQDSKSLDIEDKK